MRFTVTARATIRCVICEGETTVAPENGAVYDTDELTCLCDIVEYVEQNVPPSQGEAALIDDEEEPVSLTDIGYNELRTIAKDMGITLKYQPKKDELISIILAGQTNEISETTEEKE